MPILTRVVPASTGGGGGGGSNRVWSEHPSGVIDSVNLIYMTLNDFVAGSECVYWNGLRQNEGAGCDYVRSESGGIGTGFDTLTFAVAPRVGDIILVDYDPV